VAAFVFVASSDMLYSRLNLNTRCLSFVVFSDMCVPASMCLYKKSSSRVDSLMVHRFSQMPLHVVCVCVCVLLSGSLVSFCLK
jgi:hypothetical protein